MTQKSMKAVRIQDYGGPEVLEIVEVPIPHPGEGQVQIRVKVAVVNPAIGRCGPVFISNSGRYPCHGSRAWKAPGS